MMNEKLIRQKNSEMACGKHGFQFIDVDALKTYWLNWSEKPIHKLIKDKTIFLDLPFYKCSLKGLSLIEKYNL